VVWDEDTIIICLLLIKDGVEVSIGKDTLD